MKPCRRALTDDFHHDHFLTVFDAATLEKEKALYAKGAL
jgi:hypothetical protein